jgi:hypothetical protein
MPRAVPIRILTFSTYRIYGVYTVYTRNFRIYAVADKGKSPERAENFNLTIEAKVWVVHLLCALRNGPTKGSFFLIVVPLGSIADRRHRSYLIIVHSSLAPMTAEARTRRALQHRRVGRGAGGR